MIRVVVTGSRRASDKRFGELIRAVLDGVHRQYVIGLLGHGGAKGVDLIAAGWGAKAMLNGEIRSFPVTDADWDEKGNAAGPKRNESMLGEIRPHLVLAFPSQGPLWRSKGTWNCIHLAAQLGARLRIFPLEIETD